MSTVGLVVLIGVVVVATAAGLLRRRTTGRVRTARVAAGAAPALTEAELGQPLGARATIVQFSSAFCRPCVATRHVLADAASSVPGVAHVEVDAESNLELVRRLRVSSTPTTLLLDRSGVERGRAGGVPRKPDVLAALAQLGGG